MGWNPDQYLRFAQPRMRPAIDLLARIDAADPKFVCDLGCGAGNVTRLLAERWPRAELIGVDDSEAMLSQAARELPQVQWIRESIATWTTATPLTILYSNAALHWLPNHHALFPALINQLATGGVLAAQMPRNFLAPSHTLIAETVRTGEWRDKVKHLLIPPPVAEPLFYYELLAPLASELDIWETEYLQVLSGQDPVKEWVKGTWLKQFLDPLDADEREAFEADYAQRLRVAYPPMANGKTVFPFRRLFVVMRKK
jgi:trans-aconitate 2-methyltransferase